ncbi:fungal trichothecene efflux pump [Aulographum hederae CBS 113979]|uniref:Fungal trichothecene efflux pump n=1 Tax=Aulographum hederae CBS 113979 TaxID=1176131 RepID=A0A6G1GLP7_9PEZI|nr:fungal trichothecene efflux pump [Aulographum hederae CBS 113979]
MTEHEKNVTIEQEHQADSNHSMHEEKAAHTFKKVHADGTVDVVDAQAIGGNLEDLPPGYYTSVNFIGTVVAVSLGSICAYLGWVLPANTLTLIFADIGGDPANLNWVATSWTLGSAVGFLLVGRLSDIFGRKWMVMTTMVLSLIGNILGATSTSINQLIGANALNGLSAAAQLSHGIILGELVSNKMRGPIVTLVFVTSLPFAVFGPIIARSFILYTAAGWRWSYYIGIILCVITLVLFQFLYHPPTYAQLHVGGKTKWQQFKDLDFGGMFLFIAGMVILLIGLSWGGTAYPWSDAHVIATIVAGIATLIFFGVYETYIYKGQALMPLRLFKNVGYVAIVGIACVGAMIYYSLTVLWPTIISTVYTTDVKAIGWQSSVIGGGILLGQILGGLAISYVPKVKYQTITASVLGAAFVAALASLSPDRHAATIILGVLGCVAIGFVDNISFPGVTLVWEAQDIGLATGVLGSIRAVGGAVAQALYVSVLTTKVGENLPAYVSPAAVSAGLPESSLPQLFAGITAGDFSGVPGATPQVLAVVGQEVRRAALLILSACFVPNMEKYLKGNVAKRLQIKGDRTGGAAHDNLNKVETNV